MIHAKYTVVLKALLDNPEAKKAIDKAMSTYPLYTPEKNYDVVPNRETLNAKILNHYKYREIGSETVGRFLDDLEVTMCEIMPYYNELLKTCVIMADLPSPFDNVDVVETFEQERTDKTTGTGSTESDTEGFGTENTDGSTTGTSRGKNIRSDTPQSTTQIPAAAIDTVDKASEASWSADDNTTTSETNTETTSKTTTGESTSTESESNGTTKHTLTRKGNQGVNTYAHDMNEFRTSIIDVVEQIIEDQRIQELFMMIY